MKAGRGFRRHIPRLLRILKASRFTGDIVVEAHNNVVSLTRLDEPWLPGAGLRKGHVLYYYLLIAGYLLPLLRNRPVALEHLFPDRELPDYLRTFPVTGSEAALPVINNLASLLYAINDGTRILRARHSTVAAPEFPDRLVFEVKLEGYMAETAATAQEVRNRLEARHLLCHPITSENGIHIVVPVDPIHPPGLLSEFARRVCGGLPGVSQPEDCTIVPCSICGPNGAVSAPLLWEEVNRTLRPESFTVKNIRRRMLRIGRSLSGLLRNRQDLS